MDRAQEITARLLAELRRYEYTKPTDLVKSMGGMSERSMRIAQNILKKAMDLSRYVRVQRMRNDKTGPHLTHVYVLPGEVRSTDKVVGNAKALDEYKKQKAGIGKKDSADSGKHRQRRPKLNESGCRRIAETVNDLYMDGVYDPYEGPERVAGYAYGDFGYSGSVNALTYYLSRARTVSPGWQKLYIESGTPYGPEITDAARGNWIFENHQSEMRGMENQDLGSKPKKNEILMKIYSDALNEYAYNSGPVNKRLYRMLNAKKDGELNEYINAHEGDDVTLGALSSFTPTDMSGFTVPKTGRKKQGQRVLLEIEPSDELRGAPADDPSNSNEYMIPNGIFTVTEKITRNGMVHLKLKLKAQ